MTSFFLPHEDDHLSYVRFGPTGLLPAEFSPELGTSGTPPHMNDQNREEPARYVDPELCGFRKETNGVSTNGVTANLLFFDRGTF